MLIIHFTFTREQMPRLKIQHKKYFVMLNSFYFSLLQPFMPLFLFLYVFLVVFFVVLNSIFVCCCCDLIRWFNENKTKKKRTAFMKNTMRAYYSIDVYRTGNGRQIFTQIHSELVCACVCFVQIKYANELLIHALLSFDAAGICCCCCRFIDFLIE